MLCALCSVLFCGFAADAAPVSNIPGAIAEYGHWNTDETLRPMVDGIRSDIAAFEAGFAEQVFTQGDQFVPPEAKIGLAMINAFTMVAQSIDRTLGSFVIALLVVLFAFWVMMETYQVMKTGGNIRELAMKIVRKGLWIAVWIIILAFGPARLFMMVASPVIQAGIIMSDLILDTMTEVAGLHLLDTCGAIRGYVAERHTGAGLFNAEATADMLCIPTRLSGFFYTCVAAGWKWVAAGAGNVWAAGTTAVAGGVGGALLGGGVAGTLAGAGVGALTGGAISGGNMLTFIMGPIFIAIFARNIWLFAIEALGVVASLFLAVMFLPFTAVAECFGGGETSLKDRGIFTEFFKMLANMVGGGKLKFRGQLQTFINAAIYFVALSVVSAIGLALLAQVIGPSPADFADSVPTAENSTSFMMVLVVGMLVSHLAKKAGDIAKDLGGSIDAEFGKRLDAQAQSLRGWAVGSAKKWYGVFKGK